MKRFPNDSVWFGTGGGMAFVLFRTIRNMNQNKTYLTTKEAAEYLGVDSRTILKRIERGELKAEKQANHGVFRQAVYLMRRKPFRTTPNA